MRLRNLSLSQAIKQKVKTAVSFISDFEMELVKFARARKFDGVICGHIHHPAAGFESVCEAMYLGKPLLMVPAHIEQDCNISDIAMQ